jgi:hypothetical protein
MNEINLLTGELVFTERGINKAPSIKKKPTDKSVGLIGDERNYLATSAATEHCESDCSQSSYC